MGYTLAQFSEYSKAIMRQEKQRAHERLVLMRAAQAESPSYNKVERALRDG